MAASYRGSVLFTALLVLANSLIPISILIFATGFFPYKPVLPGLAEYETLEYGPPPVAPFDRLIFMVVDALRSDFVFLNNTGFTYTQSLIRNGAALPFTANARSPTITMPRIKAITTGSIPSFLDVILNFDEADTTSSLATQDTWLAQMKAKGSGKTIMYGDDTWLKLFPGTFDRADGTSSFFVSDFTEVDHNVTRHISDELQNDDWNTMVLHYLGLDHIGHKSGPRSPNMVPKQREMDELIRQMYEAMETQDHLSSTLMVLCGDHGMNDAGNHGASSPGETSPALVFVSPKLKSVSRNLESPVEYREDFQYYATVEQSDLAPTLGALLGFPVPKNNLGAFIVDFLPFWPNKTDQIQILLRNARQILQIVIASFGAAMFELNSEADACVGAQDEVQELACEWKLLNAELETMSGRQQLDSAWLSTMSKWLNRAQELMSSMASNYDMSKLISGQTISILSCMSSLAVVKYQKSLVPLLLVACTYGVMMFASSYVEEEHHFWYWSTSAWLGFLALKQFRTNAAPITTTLQLVVSLFATRLVRGWNQTGQKHAGEPDIVKTFISSNPPLLWALVASTYLLLHVQIFRRLRGTPIPIAMAVASALVFSAFSFKLAFTAEDAPELVVGVPATINAVLQGLSLVTRARIVFTGLATTATYSTYLALRGGCAAKTSVELLHYLYTLLAVTQSRVTNIPLFLLFQIQFEFLGSMNLDIATLSTSSLLLQYTSFFASGGTNAISSMDLSSAYNGVSGFNVIAVGLLTFVSNWAGPVYWTSAASVLLVRRRKEGEKGAFFQHAANTTLFATFSIAFIMAACTVLRAHLFIWTVFSPKYLYCMAWGVGQHLFVNIILGGGLYWIGRA